MGFWNNLFYNPQNPPPEELPETMPQEAFGLPWCKDNYDPAIDRGPNELSETGVPLPPYDEKERDFLKKYLQEIPLPAFSYTWQTTAEEAAGWKDSLLKAPFYPFLKDEPEIQTLFKKTLQAAEQELMEFPAQGEYKIKTGNRKKVKGSEFHLLVILTGHNGKLYNRALSFRCNEQ